MKTQLLKPILTVAFVILGFTNVSAQLFDFNSSKGGWNAEFQMASAELDSEDGNDVLKCLRTSNNATLALDPLVATIDAKTVRWIRIVLKNTTASTVLRIKAQSTASGNNTAQFNITANDVAFKSYAFELTSAGSAWQAAIDAGSTMEEVRLLFRAGYAAAEGNIFIDEIEFSATEPILPSTDTFSEYIQNPNFEDPDGIGFLSGGGGEYTLSLETSGSQDGANHLKLEYGMDATKINYVFSGFVKEYTPGLAVNTQLISKMWVQAAVDADVSIRLKYNDDGAPGNNGPDEKTETKTVAVTGNPGVWQELTFTHVPDVVVNKVNFWFALEYLEGPPVFPANGNVFLFDNMTGVIGATLSTDKNTLEDVKVYPNPVRETLSIKSPAGSDISIYNVLGATVKTINKANALQKVSLADLKSGLYFVKIINEGKVFQSKIIKE